MELFIRAVEAQADDPQAALLVLVVILLFLQDWRAMLVPATTVPVTIIGAFAAMAALGFTVTQATVSRDLEQLGAVKVRRDGRLGYVLPGELPAAPRPHLAAVVRDWNWAATAAGKRPLSVRTRLLKLPDSSAAVGSRADPDRKSVRQRGS